MKMKELFLYLIRLIIPYYGINKGENVRISRSVYFDNPSQVHLGNDVLINKHCKFYVGSKKDTKIIFEDNVWVGYDTCFICTSHMIGASSCRAGKGTYQNIIVGKGTWIGARCIILPNVSIGKGCIIGAGSVVTKDIPDNTLYGGVPARLIRSLE